MTRDDSDIITLPTQMDRRWLLAGIGGTALAMLAGCGSLRGTGDSVGMSSSGDVYLSRIRSERNLPALRADSQIERAALEQSALMAQSGRMAHTAGAGQDFASRMRRSGVRGGAAENLAHGRFGMDRLFDMWMASTGHRNNMLNPEFSRFGLAYTSETNGDRRYWALVLAR